MFKPKISTKPANLSVKDMYALYVKQLLPLDPNHINYNKYKGIRSSKYTWGIANNQIIEIESGKEVMNYKLFKQIISTYNKLAGEMLIKGYTLDLLNGMGNLFIARIERNPNKPRMNHHASRQLYDKLKAEGRLTKENWKVFYTDTEFISLLWHKRKVLRNILLYKFVPAGGQPGKGFRTHMSHSIIANPKLKTFYPFIPFKPKMTAEEARTKFKAA